MNRIEINILKYVPKSKLPAIKSIYVDTDGYWIVLNDGWNATRTDERCKVIHEDTIKNLRYQIAGIEREVYLNEH